MPGAGRNQAETRPGHFEGRHDAQELGQPVDGAVMKRLERDALARILACQEPGEA
ncbi:MAG: hypothetical protein HC884_17535 [Chloroflexaceae bacterium]|nr:hypothetical protein [Chloroflexaceae bacterium]